MTDTYWTVKVYDKEGRECESTRFVNKVTKDTLMKIFERIGVKATAQEYETGDDGSFIGGEVVNSEGTNYE